MRFWRTETLRRRPWLAGTILALGAGAHWYLSQPMVWRRGYPEIDPFWQVMPCLWVFPVLLSAIYDDHRWRRFCTLLTYAVLTGFTAGGADFYGLLSRAVPRLMSYERILQAAAIAVPLQFALALGVDYLARRWLRRIRGFEQRDTCGRCGYVIRHLREPRCPECGTPFDTRWLDESYRPPRAERHPWRVRALCLTIVGTAVVLPFAYHRATLWNAARKGRTLAQRDWARGEAQIYEPFGGAHRFYPCGAERVRWMHGGLEREVFERAYREVVESRRATLELPAEGLSVLTADEVFELLSSGTLEPISVFPLALTSSVAIETRAGDLYVKDLRITGDPFRVCPEYYAVLEDKDDALVLLAGGRLHVFSADGELQQLVSPEELWHAISGR